MSTLFLYILVNNLAVDLRHTLTATSIPLSVVLKTFILYILLIILLKLRESCSGHNLKYFYLATTRTPL